MKKSEFILPLIIGLFFNNLSAIKGQEGARPYLDFHVGAFISLQPDSTFELYASIFLYDSLEVTKVRFVETDSNSLINDFQFNVGSISTVQSQEGWRDGSVIHLPNLIYNPFRKKHYLVELLNSTGILLLQMEKEF
jgi:hypothetical protein